MKITRRKTRTIKIGPYKIGSGYPIRIQSMVKISVKKTERAIKQIEELEKAGCEIVRLAVEDKEDAHALSKIKKRVSLPLVADIHFDYRLALAAIEAGVDKVRLNPGNIYKPQQVKCVIGAARSASIPIRIGANSGSLRGASRGMVPSLVRSVTDYLKIFKQEKFHNVVISLKAATVSETIEAYALMAKKCDYPLHLGVTATGLPLDGVVKSSLGIGMLLFKGIGDTIRLSLLGDPVKEVEVAQILLNSLGLRKFGPELICCPTCGRCEVDLLAKAQHFQKKLRILSKENSRELCNHKIALMGCVVNGPGEAKGATMGVAFSKKQGVLFKKGKIEKTVDLAHGEDVLFTVLRQSLKRRKK